MKARTVAMIRVSTEKQDALSQRRAIEAWATSTSIYIDAWIDEGNISGALGENDRPKLARLMAGVKAGGVGTLILSEWSRLGRETISQLNRALELQRGGVRVVVLDDAKVYDLDDPDDLLMFFINAWKDHRSRLDTIKRTRRAMDGGTNDAGKRISVYGRELGRPRAPVTKDQLQSAREMREAGKSMAECGRTLGIGRNRLARLLGAA